MGRNDLASLLPTHKARRTPTKIAASGTKGTSKLSIFVIPKKRPISSCALSIFRFYLRTTANQYINIKISVLESISKIVVMSILVQAFPGDQVRHESLSIKT